MSVELLAAVAGLDLTVAEQDISWPVDESVEVLVRKSWAL
jgi:hypothetical protein